MKLVYLEERLTWVLLLIITVINILIQILQRVRKALLTLSIDDVIVIAICSNVFETLQEMPESRRQTLNKFASYVYYVNLQTYLKFIQLLYSKIDEKNCGMYRMSFYSFVSLLLK